LVVGGGRRVVRTARLVVVGAELLTVAVALGSCPASATEALAAPVDGSVAVGATSGALVVSG
jgi:hypothetical protein